MLENNIVLKFRKILEATYSAIYGILTNGVSEDSSLQGCYDVLGGKYLQTFRRIKQCNLSCLLGLHDYKEEDTKQLQNIWCYLPAERASPYRRLEPLGLLTFFPIRCHS
jgi:hypothetical protein